MQSSHLSGSHSPDRTRKGGPARTAHAPTLRSLRYIACCVTSSAITATPTHACAHFQLLPTAHNYSILIKPVLSLVLVQNFVIIKAKILAPSTVSRHNNLSYNIIYSGVMTSSKTTTKHTHRQTDTYTVTLYSTTTVSYVDVYMNVQQYVRAIEGSVPKLQSSINSTTASIRV